MSPEIEPHIPEFKKLPSWQCFYATAVFYPQAGNCYYCGVPLVRYKHCPGGPPMDNMFSHEHLVPKSLGGQRKKTSANVVPACHFCNSNRNAFSFDVFRDKIAKLIGIPADKIVFFSEVEWPNG
jgi:hypothetical protein